MADPGLSAAKAVLLAVQLAHKSDISTLRTLVSKNPSLTVEIVLRILLSHLPETLDSSIYVPFLQDLVSGKIEEDPKFPIDASALDEISNADAKKKVKRLHLLPLIWPQASPTDVPDDLLVLFLIHRSLRIDKNTGLVLQLPELLVPFLDRSPYLRAWTISTVLPLLRFNYEYHPHGGSTLTIPEFEDLDDRTGVALLLSRSSKDTSVEVEDGKTIGRDIRGLIGPWMYGYSRTKRRKLHRSLSLDSQTIAPLSATEPEAQKRTGWEEVFKWIATQATSSWRTAVEAVEQWDGPSDVDLGGYEDGSIWLDDEEQQQLEREYARAALAAAYIIPEASTEALMGVHRILVRILALLDRDRIPPLSAAAAFLAPVPTFSDSGICSTKNAKYLRNDLLQEENILTRPKDPSIHLLHALLISAFLLTKSGQKCTVRRAGELVLFQDERDQRAEFRRMMYAIGNGPKADDNYWVKTRNEILWLHGWGAENLEGNSNGVQGRGVFGLINRDFIESELLKVLLSNTRYDLARSIYVESSTQPLSRKHLQETIISAAMHAYDNATNPNKTRGGVKKCNDILKAFPDVLKGSLVASQALHLIDVTHELGKYALVLTKGEPFTPVHLRVHGDPISIIDKVLDQNNKSYTRADEFIRLGEGMVDAGLMLRDIGGRTIHPSEPLGEEQRIKSQQVMEDTITKQKSLAQKRVLGMCIENALAEDDFETAYSYVVTRLKDIAGPAHDRIPPAERTKTGLFAEPPPKKIDEWSWLAAFQAGKYKRNERTVTPTHLGNTSGNIEIRHLEQRIDCLAYALRLAPKNTLQEVLNVYRRCEEELESLVKLEAEQEAAWDAQGDEQAMPGGFAETPLNRNNGNYSKPRPRDFDEEAPMSLFDLSRSTVARAQGSLSSLALLKNKAAEGADDYRRTSGEGSNFSRVSTPDSAAHVRKRDQLKNAAVGTIASGVGWLIGAPPANNSTRDDEDN